MKKYANRYYIIYERDEKRGYVASVPAVPGCVVYGKTIKEAHKNIRFAIKECLEVIGDFKQKLPAETISPEAVRKLSFVSVPEYAKT